MKKLVLSVIAAAALASSGLALQGAAAQEDSGPPGADRMAEPGFLFDARLAGMKAALKLTPEQEKLWPAFESACRDGAKLRMEAMGAMREHMKSGERPSPIDVLTRISDHLAKASDALKKVAEAAKPLYESLNDEQKAHFGPLLHMLHGGHEGMMGMMGGGMMGGGMMGGGMMGQKPK
jgi:hypothetical protein